MNRFIPAGDLLSSVEALSDQYAHLPPEPCVRSNSQYYSSGEYYRDKCSQDIAEAELSILENITLKNKEKNSIVKALAKAYPKSSIIQSGNFYYPANAFMSWHTNSNTPGRRIYLSYSSESNKNCFKYIKNNKIIKDFDSEGWTGREFIVGDTPETFFWHAVDAVLPRISMGFRVFDNLA
tara:strand:+ start:1075 stop:1614 length:540 start_codon:yes stop_codon:yes gene_type:complete